MNERDRKVVEAVRLETYETLRAGISVQTPTGVATAALTDWHCCVVASRTAIEVLKTHYIHGRALKVQALVFTEKAWRAELAGEDLWSFNEDGDALVRDEPGFGVFPCGFRDEGRQTDQTRDGWLNGHVVVIVENEILLDPSAVQFTHLDYGLLVEPLAVDLTTPDGEAWLADPKGNFLCVQLPDGGAVLYRQSPDFAGVFDAADWQSDQIITTAVADAVKRRIEQ